MSNLSVAAKLKRPPFTKRVIRLVGSAQLATAIAMLNNSPLDADKPLLLTLGEEPKARGLDANGYYWLRLSEIAEQGWFDGRQYSKDVWHEYCRQEVMPHIITTKDGERRSKWIDCPTGKAVVISTTLLEKTCFADYTTACEAFGAGLGVQFSANPRERG